MRDVRASELLASPMDDCATGKVVDWNG
jgi:hypothetical protein